MTNEQICRVLETTETILGQTSAGEERLSYKRLKMYKIFSSSLGIYSCQGIAEVAVLSSPHPCPPKSQLVSSASSCYIRLANQVANGLRDLHEARPQGGH